MLKRQVGHPTYQPADRVFLAALSRLVPRSTWSGFSVVHYNYRRPHQGIAQEIPAASPPGVLSATQPGSAHRSCRRPRRVRRHNRLGGLIHEYEVAA